MKLFQTLCAIFTGILLFSCDATSIHNIETIQHNPLASDTLIANAQADSNSERLMNREEEADTITNIMFKDLSVSLNCLFTNSDGKEITQIQTDTAYVYAGVGENIEGQLISVSSTQLTDLIIEQRYETSITIMNEGPHCDLREWKHFYSEWKPLQTNSTGQFVGDSYSEKEHQKFPDFSITELKQKVKEQCGEEWYKLVANISQPIAYPCAVTISHYYLRITGKHKTSQQTLTKFIIIEAPMGC